MRATANNRKRQTEGVVGVKAFEVFLMAFPGLGCDR